MRPSFEQDVVVPAVQATFAALTLDSLTLVLARDEIRSLEMVDDMEPALPKDPELGWYEIQGERIPVYGLGDKLDPLRQIPPTRRIAVVTAASEASVAILCDDIAFLDGKAFSFEEIPDCMKRSGPLIKSLAIHCGAIGCVTNSESLASYFLASTPP